MNEIDMNGIGGFEYDPFTSGAYIGYVNQCEEEEESDED